MRVGSSRPGNSRVSFVYRNKTTYDCRSWMGHFMYINLFYFTSSLGLMKGVDESQLPRRVHLKKIQKNIPSTYVRRGRGGAADLAKSNTNSLSSVHIREILKLWCFLKGFWREELAHSVCIMTSSPPPPLPYTLSSLLFLLPFLLLCSLFFLAILFSFFFLIALFSISPHLRLPILLLPSSSPTLFRFSFSFNFS